MLRNNYNVFLSTSATLCDTPETPANSLLIDPKTIYASGEKARFQCAKGFYSKGIITKQCRRGIWIYGPTVTCERKSFLLCSWDSASTYDVGEGKLKLQSVTVCEKHLLK